MKIYLYNLETGEYIGQTLAYLNLGESRKQGKHVYDIPDNATDIKPPEVTNKEIAVFKNGKWLKQKDYRGTKFFDVKNKRTVIITKLGEITKDLVPLTDAKYINYLKETDITTISNEINKLIEVKYEEAIKKLINIQGHYFKTGDLPYLNLQIGEIDKQIQQKKEKIQTIEVAVSFLKSKPINEEVIEKINKLTTKQIELMDEIDNISISIQSKLYDGSDVFISVTYKELTNIVNKVTEVLKKLENTRLVLIQSVAGKTADELLDMKQNIQTKEFEDNLC